MASILKNIRLLILFALLLFSIAMILFNGLHYGIDFAGGTLFELQLKKPAQSQDQLDQITATITQRLDWTGLKDTVVSAASNNLIRVEIAETNENVLERMESLLRKQGNFEIVLDNNVILTGDDITQVIKDPSKGYGIKKSNDFFEWVLPFTLSSSGAKAFSHAAFHKCVLESYSPEKGSTYNCDKTFFFIDRPDNALIIIDNNIMSSETELPINPNKPNSESFKATELIKNANVELLVIDKQLTDDDKNKLIAANSLKRELIIPSNLSPSIKANLMDLNLSLKEVMVNENQPVLFSLTGLKTIIFLSEGIANTDIKDVEKAKIFYNLIITGSSPDKAGALESIQNLSILLESGSLPIPIQDISRNLISPALGKDFLNSAALIGLMALFTVALVIFIRYKTPKLVIPIFFTGLSELIIILGFSSLINWNLDLAAIAGIIAVVGTGVDDQIIITDELLQGIAATQSGSVFSRIKRAFFIIFAAAATTIVAMLPIILFGYGFGKLIGFAITTIIGVLIGVFITRPAFSEIIKAII